MISIEKTWEGVEQPHDEDTAGDIWFYTSTYRTIQAGLKLLLEELENFEKLTKDLKIESVAYESDLNRIRSMVEWGEQRLQMSPHDYGEVTVTGCSYKSLRYLKAALFLIANKTLEDRNSILSKYDKIPKSILQASDEKIQQILNNAEQGKMNGLRPHDLFFQLSKEPELPKVVSIPVRSYSSTLTEEITIIDQALRDRCLGILRNLKDETRQEQYDMILREMSVIMEDRIRELSRIDANMSLSKLITGAMKKDPIIIRFSPKNDYQDAIYLLFQGYAGFIRNDVMHRLVPSYTYERVIQLLGFVDYLLFLLSTAELKHSDK